MSEERLDELREILHNPNLKGYLPNVCNELLQELMKKENIINEFEKWLDEESEKTILSTGERNSRT